MGWMTRCWGIMLGNFVFENLESAYDPDDGTSVAIAALFYYFNVALMLLLLFNMLIAIFMDGYARGELQ
jgi:hypothetical protein